MNYSIMYNIIFFSDEEVESEMDKLNNNEQMVYDYLKILYKEGTATYFADVYDFEGDYVEQHKDRQWRNLNKWKMQENFTLMETILFRCYNDDALESFSPMYNIGFSWNWENPSYYVGYYMCQTIEKYKGEVYLKNYLDKSPLLFIQDYIEISKANANDEGLIQISDNIIALINKVASKV